MLNSSSDSRVTIGNPIINEPDRAIATVTRELVLTQTSTSDAGSDYSCRATNAAMGGEDSEGFELYVQGKCLYIFRIHEISLAQVKTKIVEA